MVSPDLPPISAFSGAIPSRVMAFEDVPLAVREQVARLDHHERTLIRETYEKMTGESPNYALALFIGLFAEHPEYKNIWPQFRAVADSALHSSQCLQNHAFVYMGGLKDIVRVMEDEEQLCRMCRKIALSHHNWNIRKAHIENMVPELLAVMEKACGKMADEEKAAWTKLYDIIGNLIDYYKKQAKKR